MCLLLFPTGLLLPQAVLYRRMQSALLLGSTDPVNPHTGESGGSRMTKALQTAPRNLKPNNALKYKHERTQTPPSVPQNRTHRFAAQMHRYAIATSSSLMQQVRSSRLPAHFDEHYQAFLRALLYRRMQSALLLGSTDPVNPRSGESGGSRMTKALRTAPRSLKPNNALKCK